MSSGLLNWLFRNIYLEGSRRGFIARLLDGIESVRGSLPETELGQQPVKLQKTGNRYQRLDHLQIRAQHSFNIYAGTWIISPSLISTRTLVPLARFSCLSCRKRAP